jgi:ABC-type uncharacterized transport system involved in gliding motility auxiliary subunit
LIVNKTILSFVTGGVALALIFVAWVYPEVPTASYTLGTLLALLLAALAFLNQKALKEAAKTRSVRYGTNAAVTVGLIGAILIVLNYLNFHHFVRKDLTKDKVHSLSDQTTKVVRDLPQEVQLTVFVKSSEREAVKPLIENYRYAANKKLKVEYVDPDRDPNRAKALNVKKYGTIVVQSGKREARVEDANEEKLTNAILKVLKDKAVTACFLIGHGEKSPEATDAEGYSQIKKEFELQNYESKTVNLLENPKIPAECTLIVVAGPTKAFFEKELTEIRSWLDAGGRALFALDPNLRSEADLNADLKKVLADWYIDVKHNLVLDPASRAFGMNESVPLIAIYNTDHPITKPFANANAALFPLPSTVETKASPPANLKTWWLAKSTPRAFAKTDFKEIATGKVKLDEKKDQAGPFSVMVAVEGGRGDKKPERATKIVALGTSQMAANRWAGHGANSDLFMNSISWLADDENLISIRSKEEGASSPQLTNVEARYIQLIIMLIVPGSVLLMGLFVWLRRRGR